MAVLKEIELRKKLTEGKTEITSVKLMEPSAGSLRGLQLGPLVQMDVNSIIKLLPRITDPILTEDHVAELHPADLAMMGALVSGFLNAPEAMGELL